MKSTPAPNAQPPAQQPPSAPQSIYPEPTAGIGAPPSSSAPAAPQNDQTPTHQSSSGKVVAIRALATLLILVNVINAYDWYLEQRAGYTSWTSLIGIILGLVLAVGIFKLNEAARFAYVLISVFMLALAGVGLILFYSSTHRVLTVQTHSSTELRSELEKALDNARKNPTLSPAQKKKAEQQTQKEIDNLSGSPTDLKVKQYISEGLLVLVAIGPLIFLTRSSIKAEFK